MSANSNIKVWKREPGLADYTPGMDLGEPDEIHEPTFFIVPSEPIINTAASAKERAKRGRENRRPRKSKALTKEAYLQLQADGLTRLQIAEKYDIKHATLKSYLSGWGLLIGEPVKGR